MSAVIWLGIVAVWAFVLIPTWVRRSDIHWRRSGEASGARDKIGRAARVINRSGSGASAGARGAVPGMRRPSSAPRRTVAAMSSSSTVGGRATAVLDEPTSASEARTETLTAIRVDEPATEQLTAIPQTETDTESGSTATSAQAADPAATEAPMTTPHTSRPAPRRGATRVTQSTPPPHVQRARRLVWIGAAALATLLLAFIFGGWWIALNLLADVALVGYVRHLRAIAVQQQAARRGRRHSGRATEERDDEVLERAAPRAQRRAPAPRHRAAPAPARSTAPVAAPAAPAASVAPEEAPVEVIDLTDEAMHDDCPTTELISARAV
jgi:hypothetical protein